jgi:hypothetical protein
LLGLFAVGLPPTLLGLQLDPDAQEVFADGLNIPVGVAPLPRAPGSRGAAVIVHSIPGIWRWPSPIRMRTPRPPCLSSAGCWNCGGPFQR